MTRQLTRYFALCAMLAVAVAANAAPQMLPTAVGNKWEYDSVKMIRASIKHVDRTLASMRDTSSGSTVYEIVSVDKDTNRPVFDYREITEMRSTSSGETDSDKSELKITRDDKGLHILSTFQESSGYDDTDSQTYDPPLFYSPADLSVGKTWEVGTVRERQTSSPIAAKVVGKETVTVPAGTFKDCLKVVYSTDEISGTMDMWEKTFNMTGGRMRGVYWVADGVGVVKELEVSTTTAQTSGPDGKPITIEAASCIVTELKPGYIVKE